MEASVRLLMKQDVRNIKKFSSFAVSRYLKSSNSFCIVAETGDTLLGFLACDIDGDITEITSISVAEPVRRRRVGTTLVEQLLTMIEDDHSIEAVVRESNLGAQCFFGSLGFKVVNKREKDNQDAYLMRLGWRFRGEPPEACFRRGGLDVD